MFAFHEKIQNLNQKIDSDAACGRKKKGRRTKNHRIFIKSRKKRKETEKNIILYANGKNWVGDNKNIDKK